MITLKEPKLGTSKTEGWSLYHLQEASVYLLDEMFIVSSYKNLLRTAKLGRNGQEVWKFSKQMKEESYHALHAHSFIGGWSALESGLHNNIAAIIGNDEHVADKLLSNLGKFKVFGEWPWDDDERVRIAQQAERYSKSKNQDKSDFSTTIKIMYSLIGVDVDFDIELVGVLNEANRARNIFLHRSGRVMKKDAADFEGLSPFVGRKIHMEEQRFRKYNDALLHVFASLVRAIPKSSFFPR